ncbi:MAG: sigma-54-dependent Fis family transcriptional regulator, partial [Planctomycetota bacterium]
LSEAALNRIMRLPLPGNVRELENLLQRMLALAGGDELGVELLEGLGGEAESEGMSLEQLRRSNLSLDEALEDVERRLVREALAASGGHVTRAAALLGISFRSLRYRLKKLGVKPE